MKLYRKFRVDADGKPIVGTKFGMLGVRPTDPNNRKKRADVKAVNGSDLVRRGGGGLSVYTDPTAILIQAADLVLCEIDTADLPPGLLETAASKPHYLIEPSQQMTLDEYQELLADTQDLWQPV